MAKINQPRVIAEVIGGIILGPSVCGHIPGFNDKIFPASSLSYLNLVATLGLVLFLFLVGLEVDLRLMTKNARSALTVSAAGLVLPFGLGAAVSYGLYNEFGSDNPVGFGKYLLFTGVAMAITAFPVLARILTELKLLSTTVGVLVLSAGVGNDVVGWILLALTVALVNAGSGITALWVLLLAVGWTLILVYIIRPAFMWLCVRTGSLENGPTQGVVTTTLILVLASAFVTDIIGVHPIFGGFLVGLIIPHDGGFAVAMTEKIEDLVSVLFLPLYFALSGLKTNIGLLDDGITWAYVILVIVVALFGKIFGCTIAAKMNGFVWREAFTIGVLMSCKGLVELIVLNIGLQARILNTKVFTIFVVMALVTTFLTTPLTIWLYPVEYRRQMEAKRRGASDSSADTMHSDDLTVKGNIASRIMVVLNRIEYLPSMMTLVQILQPQSSSIAEEPLNKLGGQLTVATGGQKTLTINALRLVELSERTSAAMKASDVSDTIRADPVLNVFRTFSQLNHIGVSTNVSIVSQDDFARNVTDHARDTASQMMILPWAGAGAIIDDNSNPLEHLFGARETRHTSPHYGNFVKNVFRMASCTVGVFIDRGFGLAQNGGNEINEVTQDTRHRLGRPILPGTNQRILVPFFGGADDREALHFAAQLCQHHGVSAVILRLVRSDMATAHDIQLSAPTTPAPVHMSNPMDQMPPMTSALEEANQMSVHRSFSGYGETVMHQATVDKLASQTADELALAQYFGSGDTNSSAASMLLPSSGRLTIERIETSTPLQTAVQRARGTLTRKDLVLLGCGRQGGSPHADEIVQLLKNVGAPGGYPDVRKTLGNVAEGMLVGGVKASVMIIQASRLSSFEDKKTA